MSTPGYLLSALGVIIAASIAAWGSGRVQRRINSGSAKTTDAKTLWDAAEKMRKELVADIFAMKREVSDAHAEAAKCRADSEDARIEIGNLRAEITALRATVARLESAS